MAEMKNEDGIKLFGTTIMFENQKKKELVKLEEGNKSENGEKRGPEKIIGCPRCKSMDTKFCYFNNYNVNQPRHFCKACQRYWTAGGALRNVPVGAGRRKSKPPCPCPTFDDALPQNCVFDSSGLLPAVQPFQLEGMVHDDWHVVASSAAAAHGGFRQILPVKRRRDCQDGQTC